MYHLNNGHSTHPKFYRAPALAGSGGETTLRRSLRILRRRQWVFMLVAGGVFTLAVAYAYTRPVSYRSEAQIEVGAETPLSPADLIGEAKTRSLPPFDHYFKTQEALIRREGLIRQVIESLPKGVVQPYLDSKDPVRKLSRHIDVADIPGTYVIKVALEQEQAAGGPEIVNKLVDLYIEDSNRRLHAQILGVLEDLEKKTLPEIHQRVIDSEKKLQEFVTTNGFGGVEAHSSLLAERERLAARIFDLRMRAFEFRMDPTRSFEDEDPESFLGSPRVIDSLLTERGRLEMEIARQSAILKPGHPTMVGLNNSVESVNTRLKEAIAIATGSRDRVLERSAERVKKRMEEADAQLKELLNDEKSKNEAIATASAQLAEYAKLDGEVKAAREIYNTYLTKQAEVKAMAGAGVASVRVVDRASSPLGSRKDTQLILTLGAVLGLLLGVVGVILAEQNDDRALTPFEAEMAVGVDVLISIPKLSKPLGHRGPILPKDNPLKSPLEPFRRLRLEVAARLHGLEGSRVVAIIGDGLGEGKSTVAVNLARVLGLEKRKVLLVDGEFRRPRLKALLGDAKAPGLEEYLRSDAHFRDVVQQTKLPGVDVLGASKAMEEAPEMPSMERIRELWRKARSFYDYVIVDAGPVSYFSESAGLATQADATVLVMDERRSRLRDVLSARRTLENLDARIIGMVVNRSADPTAGGLVSRLMDEMRYKANGHAAPAAPVTVAVSAPANGSSGGPGENPALKTVLDRLFQEMDSTKERANNLEHDKAGLTAREEQLRKAMEDIEREHNEKLEGELRKNADLAMKFTQFVEASRAKEEEQLKKLEVIFTKSLEGVNKKLTDLRLRSFAGGGGAGGGMEGDVQLRPSQATIDGIFSQKIESNIPTMEKPQEKKATGGVSNALDRLKNLRTNASKKEDDEKKK
jgi:succinoglycan biosynthesis transport protein ExoP